ncbi:hypothetical protein MesoLjLa_66460 (plasmid) [Mesorhizobium sp. L-2-11]|nr:hypothetical protein MesoLjLa_66460 [Mesorhizobium sp. L-2-11]
MERYRAACQDDKRRILGQFVAVTGYYRKHAVRVMNRREQRPSAGKSHSRFYGSDVREAPHRVVGGFGAVVFQMS